MSNNMRERMKDLLSEIVADYGRLMTDSYLHEEYGIPLSYDPESDPDYSYESLDQIVFEYGGEVYDLFSEGEYEARRLMKEFVNAGAADGCPAGPAVQTVSATTVNKAIPAQPVKKVTYPDPRKDSFEATFNSFEDLVSCIEDLEKTETVYSHDEDLVAAGGLDTKNVTVRTVLDAPVAAQGEAKRLGCDREALEDTMRSLGGTGLYLQIESKNIPVGASAMGGLRDRAGFTGDGLDRHLRKSAEDAAAALNRQFANWDSSATVIERAGKVRSFMSRNFAYGKYTDILTAFEEFWKQKYPLSEVKNCYVSHTIMRWEMSLEPYKTQFFRGFQELLNSGYIPMLIFSVSNTGDSAFRIAPALGQTGSSIVVPIAQFNGNIAVRHVAKGNFQERCDALLEQIMVSYAGVETMMDNANANLANMQKTNVRNAYNALLRTMDDCGFPKQQGMEAATNFKNVYGNGSATAFDCFIACMNAYSFVCRDYADNTTKKFATSLSVGKAANAPWQMRGEIPGDYAW